MPPAEARSLMNVLASPVQAVPWQLANPLLWYTPDRLGSAAASMIANAASAAAAVMAWARNWRQVSQIISAPPGGGGRCGRRARRPASCRRSEEPTSELQSPYV